MLTLRTTRFRGTFATLIIQECADRSRVLVEMEDDAGHGGDHKRNIFLKTPQWKHLTQLPYLHRSRDDGEDHPPAGTFESTEFVSHDRTLRVVEMPEGDVVRIEMFKEVGPENDHEWLSIDLTAAQWLYLTSLDYIVDGAQAPSPHVSQPLFVPPTSRLH
jgi:hypothetical protein